MRVRGLEDVCPGWGMGIREKQNDVVERFFFELVGTKYLSEICIGGGIGILLDFDFSV